MKIWEGTGFSRRIGAIKADLVVSTCLFFIFLSLGVHLAPVTGESTMAELRQWIAPVVGMGPVGMLLFIVVNNVVKAFIVIVSGLLLGLPPLLFIAINGITVGSLAGAVSAKTGYGVVIAGLLPHGIIELPALVMATALGFSLGKEALFWLLKRNGRVKMQFFDALFLYLRLILPALLIAALIEVTVTPLLVNMIKG